MVERLLIYRIKKRRFCHITFKKEDCFGACRIEVSSGSDERGDAVMCSVYEERLDELLNGDGSRR